MDFTPEQKTVIESRGEDTLVSAAAGSGKTAVIVERIVTRVIREGVDLDRLLVVTYTKAAAAEMKERIRDALQAELNQLPPENEEKKEHLERQLTVIFSAPIMTIDSFCLEMIRNHFNVCGIDPAFRVADEGELTMLRADVMEKLMERHYEEDPEQSPFYDFLERFSVKRSDGDVTDAIEKLYRFAVSRPDVKGYLRGIADEYLVSSEEELTEKLFMKECMRLAKARLGRAENALDQAIRLALMPEGPEIYLSLLKTEREQIRSLLSGRTYKEWKAALDGASFGRLPSRKNDPADPELKERAKVLRESAKKAVGDLREKYFSKEPEEIISELSECLPSVKELSALTLEYAEDYAEAKRKRGIVDFSDLEHFALQILSDEEMRKRYREYFSEIIVDEYQDSNRVQEAIFSSISNGKNYFCVGDVKQSIYSFRDACPGLFMNKYDRYGKPGGEAEDDGGKTSGRLLTLAKNFRSRESVLTSVNAVFRQIMHRETGGVEYDSSAFLNYGGLYSTANMQDQTEYLLTETDPTGITDKRTTEAQAVAQRIMELVGSFSVEDVKKKESRPCTYGDIVILLRARSGWDEVFLDVLSSNGIPVQTESRSGYLLSFEIRNILNF